MATKKRGEWDGGIHDGQHDTEGDAPFVPEHTPTDPGTATLERRTPEEWRVALAIRASRHACARQLHGWHEHEHHEGIPMQITESAYREALDAAQADPCVPSPNALSPHRGRGR